MPPKSRQLRLQAQTDRAEASSLAFFLPAASAANAAPSTREAPSPDVLRRAIERGNQAAVDRVIAPCTSCMRSIRGARHVLEGSSRPRAATSRSACGLCGQRKARLTGSLLYLLRCRRVFYSLGGHHEGAGRARSHMPYRRRRTDGTNGTTLLMQLTTTLLMQLTSVARRAWCKLHLHAVLLVVAPYPSASQPW